MTEIKLPDSLSPFFGDDDFEVAGILVELECLFLKSEPPYQLPSDWSSKRKRSTIDSLPSSSSRQPQLPPPPSTATAKCGATSPSTPLSFSPSEPDCKSRPSRKRKVTKKPMEELQKLLFESTQERAKLQEEIENTMLRFNVLKAENSRLENLKHKLSRYTNGDEEGEIDARLEACKSMNLATGVGLFRRAFSQTQPTISLNKMMNPPVDSRTHQVPRTPYRAAGFVINQTAQIEPEFQYRGWGPISLPDLNVSAEEGCSEMDLTGKEEGVRQQQHQPLDVTTAASREHKAAMARHNRHLRKVLNRMKMPRVR